MYKTFVRPHLIYCDIIYHIPPKQDQLGVVLNGWKVQYQATLAVTGTWQGPSRSKLYEELGWESLSDRRWCRRFLQIHKILNNKTPSYLHLKLPCRRRPLYRLNIENNFYEIRCKSSRYMNSLFPDGTKTWNNVIGHFPNIPSINILKGHILSLIRPEKFFFFNIHDPIGLRYLFYLMVNLSPLRSHKHRHEFNDTPSDKCLCNHGIEDTNHFLFSCSFFTIQRTSLRASVAKILQKYNLNDLINNFRLYLYGHRTINLIDNRIIFLSTIAFIKDTKFSVVVFVLSTPPFSIKYPNLGVCHNHVYIYIYNDSHFMYWCLVFNPFHFIYVTVVNIWTKWLWLNFLAKPVSCIIVLKKSLEKKNNLNVQLTLPTSNFKLQLVKFAEASNSCVSGREFGLGKWSFIWRPVYIMYNQSAGPYLNISVKWSKIVKVEMFEYCELGTYNEYDLHNEHKTKVTFSKNQGSTCIWYIFKC